MSRTLEAVEKRRLAARERSSPAGVPALADAWDQQADDLLSLARPPAVGPGGEVAADPRLNAPRRRLARETLGSEASAVAIDASIRRLDLLHQPALEVVAEGLDMAEAVDAGNSLERAIAHQLASLHDVALRQLNRAMRYQVGDDPAANQEAVRCLNVAARLLGAFNDCALTLQRLRGGGEQRVHVEHVHVGAGGQAIVGHVTARGPKRTRGRKPK